MSRAEGLEDEHLEMQRLCQELSGIGKTKGMAELSRAQKIIAKLRSMNLRWNIPELSEFLRTRQKELFFGLASK
ncbi:MAG: hypothetical protein AB1921_10510 [Thermodesulfobacteriota bacterium]